MVGSMLPNRALPFLSLLFHGPADVDAMVGALSVDIQSFRRGIISQQRKYGIFFVEES